MFPRSFRADPYHVALFLPCLHNAWTDTLPFFPDQWCLRMYAFALRRWPSLAEQFTFDGAWDQDDITGEGMMCLEDVRIQGHFVDGVPSGKCTVTITRATEAKSFDFNFDDQH